MKKKLEAELISIAHRILKLKNKSELDQLYVETQKLYEKLAVLKFVEENFADVKPTIGHAAAEEILETAFDEPAETPVAEAESNIAVEETVLEVAEAPSEVVAKDTPQPGGEDDKDDEQDEQKIQEPEKPEEEKLAPDATPIEKEADEVIAEAEEAIASDKTEAETESDSEIDSEEAPVTEAGIDFEQPEATQEIAAASHEAKQDDLFKPTFEWAFDAKSEGNTEEKAPSSQQTSQVAFEDLLGAGYKDPVFVKPEDESKETDVAAENSWIEPNRFEQPEIKADVIPITRREDKVPVFKMNNDGGTINDRMSKGITVGLNDRIAFVKNLFNNSNEEYNRVLSQLLTFDTIEEAQDFIDNMVKPDYNNWEGKDDFAQRFMEVIEKKFS
jgi:hypothetical protein